MSLNPFEKIIWDLSEDLGETLSVDMHGVCRLNIDDTLSIQLEYDETDHTLIFIALIVELPPGPYRETVLKEALKSNSQMEYLTGKMAYLPNKQTLVMFEKVESTEIEERGCSDYLAFFIKKAKNWQRAVTNNQFPVTS